MQRKNAHRGWWIGGTVILLLASGCFQPAGQEAEPISVVQSGATFTPPPSPTPEPTLTPETFFVTPTESLFQVIPTIDPNDTTFGQGGGIPTIDPNQTLFQESLQQVATEAIDPMFITATFIVQRATDAEAANLTATAASLGIGFPTSTPTPDPLFGATQAPILPGTDCVHQVVAGENLFRLSLRYGVTLNDLALRNGIANPSLILVGQRIVIPGCGTTGVFPPPTTVPTPGGVLATSAVATAPPVLGGGTTYVVQQGDTLFEISLRFGVPVTSIAAANGITDISLIHINQTLIIPPA